MSLSDEAQRQANLARAQLASTRASLCPCGVRPRDCLDHDPRNQPSPEPDTTTEPTEESTDDE